MIDRIRIRIEFDREHMCIRVGHVARREPTQTGDVLYIRLPILLFESDSRCLLPILLKESTRVLGKVRVLMSCLCSLLWCHSLDYISNYIKSINQRN